MFAEAGARGRSPDVAVEVRALRPVDVALLRLGGPGRASAADVRALVESFPGRSVWAPDSREYALVAQWRHRDEIAVVQSLVAVRHAEVLLSAAVDRCRAAGDALVVLMEMDDMRRPSFYEGAGFRFIEEVITYELVYPRRLASRASALTFVPVVSSDGNGISSLLRIDHSAFPWLWWNSEQEFQVYAGTPGVELYLGLQDATPVAYVGLTTYAGWGHLDRIAVEPAAQGSGLGWQALGFAVDTLARRGARRIGLSTQRDNVRSQRLYERFGFRRSPGHDYRLYGAELQSLTLNGGPAQDPASGGDGGPTRHGED